MKSLIFYLGFALYMLLSLLRIIKLKHLKRKGNKEEIDRYINKSVVGWAKFIVNGIGIKINKKGLENVPDGPCLFVGNHQGLLDVPVIVSSLDRYVGFVAKKEMLKLKILTYWMKEMKCVFMDRQNVRAAVKTINEGVENLKNGYSMLIFPEGTRSRGENLGEFKKGSMKLGIKAGVPIVPIAIDGTYNVLEANGKKIKAADVDLIICPPIYPNELSKEEQNNLSVTIKDVIQKELEKTRN
ncbi:1-acyl-sn-glycerol-3-phosphate acyltransferase [Clostridium botulinum]|uniref:1-acyl-sn-glycerol-3-phosphate acyltransferase n=1 Tax=Clostridium botulinum (strain Hall / ATCC 3502 / NCTC 13319 / Type A) TaxID=441771 RepID=A5HYW0_CLOBH|nr:lysophospholipid acyltransferase family protein [Clostridium botulinum]NFL68617.1 1-acyl-sn-glycerol-3-phosphate acyltransferase [Clostridium botulinum]NFQ53318.1 1-acyl-sn-glycerol-3-phosphate acyltransferase [Clostridium botulinum]NFT47159.1 1-acyl-sn-glycerol-3-phosphate acyltransferase [Clostridium botulinum]QGT43708.1 1-acyl-sn-glycerol-3-phosphate acyltransferase [Clostridium botulinum]RUT53126.1 1-acylglycerol-3-phosphate O-acyltransferases domain protein [Clostridium botulinum]